VTPKKRAENIPGNIPASVRVGAVTYRIIMDTAEVKAASDSANSRGEGEWLAFSDHDKLIIGLNPDRADDANRVSLLHELLHCALRHSGACVNTYADVVYEARDRVGGLTVEEFAVAAMAGPMLSVLLDNPDLSAYLLSD
jgi:hypothetical protein